MSLFQEKIMITQSQLRDSDLHSLQVDPKRTIFLLCGSWWENEIIECEKFRELIKT